MNMKSKFCIIGNQKKPDACKASIENDVLCIECTKCNRLPDTRSSECISCIIKCISEVGSSERLRLRTSRDVEVSGTAADILCELASVDRSVRSMSKSDKTRSCNGCRCSPNYVFDRAWQSFPDPNFDMARKEMMSFRPEGRSCENCLMKTYRALDQAEYTLSGIRKKIAIEAVRAGVR